MVSGKTSFGLLRFSRFIVLISCLLGIDFSLAAEIDPVKMTKALSDIHKKQTVSAASVLVVSQDEVLVNLHTGVRDWATKLPFSNKDMYRLGSISKSFAGVLALRLQQQGLINLDDAIADYGLTPYLTDSFNGRPTTLAQLLEHTAGLADLAKAEWDYNDSKPISLKQAFELKLGKHKTRWPANMHQSYSNVGPGLFGLALELKLGESYEALMQKYVFDPLSMTSSSLLLTPNVKQHLITGYDRDGQTPIKYWHNIYRPFAAINTNNQEMIHWLQMLLQQDNSFLSTEDRKRLVQPTSTLAAQSGLDFGYGLGIYQWQTDGHSFYGHGGDADGYLTRFGINPESGVAYFVMINAFNKQPLKQMVDLIEQQIVQGLPKPKYPNRLSASSTQLAQYIGSYRPVTARFGAVPSQSQAVVEIFAQDQKLFYRYKNQSPTAIHRVKDNLFRTTHESVATMAFSENKGDLYFQGKLGNFVKVSE